MSRLQLLFSASLLLTEYAISAGRDHCSCKVGDDIGFEFSACCIRSKVWPSFCSWVSMRRRRARLLLFGNGGISGLLLSWINICTLGASACMPRIHIFAFSNDLVLNYLCLNCTSSALLQSYKAYNLCSLLPLGAVCFDYDVPSCFDDSGIATSVKFKRLYFIQEEYQWNKHEPLRKR